MISIGSLFSGYGGLDMAAEQALGGSTVWHAETDRAANFVLARNWPSIPNLGDVATVDWATVPPVDVLTGGFPCQDVSMAGHRAGMRSDTRSGLWSHMAHAINVLQPSLVIIENVRGLLSASADSDVEPCTWCMGDEPGVHMRALGAVLADLASLGFDARWCGLRASDVGAPHPRFRVFIAAYPQGKPWRCDDGNHPHASPYPTGERRRKGWPQPARQLGRPDPPERGIWGGYESAIRRWEHITGRPAPDPTSLNPAGQPRLDPRFVEWMMGLPDGHVTADPGLYRTEQLRVLGNGVVPQQAEAAIRLLTH